MDAHVEAVLAQLNEKVAEKEREFIEAKRKVNSFCEMMELPPQYAEEAINTSGPIKLRGHEYYGQSLQDVVTKILNQRNSLGLGPATVKEVYEKMKEGGYHFETKNDENAMRGLRISLAKTQAFHKLPSGLFGLREWYPNIKNTKKFETDADVKGDAGEEDTQNITEESETENEKATG